MNPKSENHMNELKREIQAKAFPLGLKYGMMTTSKKLQAFNSKVVYLDLVERLLDEWQNRHIIIEKDELHTWILRIKKQLGLGEEQK